jgi:hypothetical protein
MCSRPEICSFVSRACARVSRERGGEASNDPPGFERQGEEAGLVSKLRAASCLLVGGSFTTQPLQGAGAGAGRSKRFFRVRERGRVGEASIKTEGVDRRRRPWGGRRDGRERSGSGSGRTVCRLCASPVLHGQVHRRQWASGGILFPTGHLRSPRLLRPVWQSASSGPGGRQSGNAVTKRPRRAAETPRPFPFLSESEECL